MGLNFISNILSVYKADTTDAKRKVKELRGEQRAAAKAMLEDLEKQNEKIDQHVKTIGKITNNR